jgi:hypothetical protein
MDITNAKDNAKSLAAELQWLNLVISTRMTLYWGKKGDYNTIYDIQPPDLNNDPSYYAQVIAHYNMNFDERIILILSLVPHLQPQLLDVFFCKECRLRPWLYRTGRNKGKESFRLYTYRRNCRVYSGSKQPRKKVSYY